jgi:HK97 gp10 family phage protein
MSKLVSKLSFIARDIDGSLGVALEDTVQFILTLIRILVRVDTGFLRDSYQKENIGLLHVLIGSMVNYSIFQEYGTTKMAAHPHLTPAFMQGEQFFRERLKEVMKHLG